MIDLVLHHSNRSGMTGFAAGIPTALGESLIGLAQMALSPIQTYKAIKEIISSENALGNITDAVKQDYTNRINKLEAEYQKAGPSGSYKAGLEAGKLTTDVVSLLAGGAGLAKGGVVLTEKITAKFTGKATGNPATWIDNNFYRDDSFFTAVAQQMEIAKRNNWKTPDGKIWWPPENGIVPNSQFKTTLPIGTKLDRYGGTSKYSSFLAPVDVPINARALSPNTNLQIHDVYEVIKPLPVVQSNVMPWFGKVGMGIQYETKGGINLMVQQLVEKGYLRKASK